MKLYLNQKDILSMVSEVVRHLGGRTLLSEITAQDAYARFYADRLPQKIYDCVMAGAPNMTPLHKLALDHLVVICANEKPKAVPKIAKLVSNFWTTASEEAKQYAVKVCKDENNELKNDLEMFEKTIVGLSKMKSHSENSYSNRGLEVLYESDNLRVTCTKSYTSSCKNFGDSHWCTASDQFGEYDGFEMFLNYAKNGILVQFYRKDDEDCSFQVHYKVGPRSGVAKLSVACNWEDNQMPISAIKYNLNRIGESYDDIFTAYIQPNAKRLFVETHEINKDEIVYYEKKKTERLKKIKASLSAGVNGKDVEELARTLLAKWKQNPGQITTQNYLYSQDNSLRAYRENDGTDLAKETNLQIISVTYNGRTEAERNFLEHYGDLSVDEAIEEYGVPNNIVTFVFDGGDNIIGKYIGEVSCFEGYFAIITDIYDDDLYVCNVVAVINVVTGEVVARNCAAVNIDDMEDYISDIDRFSEKYGGEIDFIFGYEQNETAIGISTNSGKVFHVPYIYKYFINRYHA